MTGDQQDPIPASRDHAQPALDLDRYPPEVLEAVLRILKARKRESQEDAQSQTAGDSGA